MAECGLLKMGNSAASWMFVEVNPVERRKFYKGYERHMSGVQK